jgi:drug/metabolite transporter (DMT)-like permease
MALTFLVGLGLAALSAAASQLGFLFRHRGAVAAPDVDPRHPLRSAIGLFRSKWWTIGYAVAALAYLLHVGALGLAPLSLVQAVLASGLVMLGVLAERFFGFHLGRREWAGIGLAGAGLAVLAATGETGGDARSEHSLPAMIAFEGALVAVGAALILSRRARRARDQRGVLLGVAAGLLFTVTHVGVKAMSSEAGSGLAQVLLSPYLPVVVVCAVVAFFASARSLQIGEGVTVIALTSIAGNASAIPAGIVVFGDPLGGDALEIGVRALAFLMVVISAALIPAPVRAAGKARAAGMRAARERSAQPA